MNSDSRSGIVTLLFTDIEGSTRLWEQEPERMRPALECHDALLRKAVESNHGVIVKMTGDGVHAAFDDPLQGVKATLALLKALDDPGATNGLSLHVRCGLHVGTAERRNNDFFGSAVNRAARIMSAAHGGQVLLSQAAAALIADRLPAGVTLRDLGAVRLRDLASPEHVHQVVHSQLRQEFPALRLLEATPNNLPQQVTSFIGREQALAESQRLLARTRLLTLTGSGGCGKTRLSLQIAADLLEQFSDGAWFVDLAPLVDPALVPSALAQVLHVTESAGQPLVNALCNHLRTREILLILDNCEHLLDGCAQLADTLVRQCPNLTILASSREALGIGGEQAYRVPSLSLPDPKQAHTSASVAPFEAVQLFTDRALLARPDFRVTDQNASTLASVCYRLDGIPLAIELAAARVRSLSVEEINRKLDQRFLLLTAGSRAALPRQQTLRSLIDWSYDLLHEPEKRLLQRLSIFAGGWTLAAAEQVCVGEGVEDGEVLELLPSLSDKSLVVVEQNDGHYRYRLLETIRAYAAERLTEFDEADLVARSHATYFRDRFAQAPDDWLKLTDADWRAAYLPERDNIRAAIDWAFAPRGDLALGIALVAATGPLWSELSLLNEGQQRLETAAGRMNEQTPDTDRARLWLWLGLLWGAAVSSQAVFEKAVDAYRRLGDATAFGHALARLSITLTRGGQFEPAAQALKEALPALERARLPKALAHYHRALAFLDVHVDDAAGAKEHFEQAASLYRTAGSERNALSALGDLANLNWELGDLDAALAGFKETVALMRNASATSRVSGVCLMNLQGVHIERGELAEALVAAREGLPLLQDGGYAWLYLDCAALGAALSDRIGDAARVIGYADSMFQARSQRRSGNEARARARLHELLHEKLAPAELQRLLAEGTQLSDEEVCKLALAD